jgi:hypothetical protein
MFGCHNVYATQPKISGQEMLDSVSILFVRLDESHSTVWVSTGDHGRCSRSPERTLASRLVGSVRQTLPRMRQTPKWGCPYRHPATRTVRQSYIQSWSRAHREYEIAVRRAARRAPQWRLHIGWHGAAGGLASQYIRRARQVLRTRILSARVVFFRRVGSSTAIPR